MNKLSEYSESFDFILNGVNLSSQRDEVHQHSALLAAGRAAEAFPPTRRPRPFLRQPQLQAGQQSGLLQKGGQFGDGRRGGRPPAPRRSPQRRGAPSPQEGPEESRPERQPQTGGGRALPRPHWGGRFSPATTRARSPAASGR